MAILNLPVGAGSVKQQEVAPTRKVIASGVAGSITTILIFVLNTYLLNKPLPAEIAAAVDTLITFLVGYLVPPAVRDQITSD